MSIELYWLTLTVMMTALLWVPYILDRIKVRGLDAITDTKAETGEPHSAWAQSAMRAHQNAVENLVIFGLLVLIIHSLGISNTITQTAVAVYFFARLTHYLVYIIGVPVARTLIFAIGWAVQMALAFSILGWV